MYHTFHSGSKQVVNLLVLYPKKKRKIKITVNLVKHHYGEQKQVLEVIKSNYQGIWLTYITTYNKDGSFIFV